MLVPVCLSKAKWIKYWYLDTVRIVPRARDSLFPISDSSAWIFIHKIENWKLCVPSKQKYIQRIVQKKSECGLGCYYSPNKIEMRVNEKW